MTQPGSGMVVRSRSRRLPEGVLRLIVLCTYLDIFFFLVGFVLLVVCIMTHNHQWPSALGMLVLALVAFAITQFITAYDNRIGRLLMVPIFMALMAVHVAYLWVGGVTVVRMVLGG